MKAENFGDQKFGEECASSNSASANAPMSGARQEAANMLKLQAPSVLRQAKLAQASSVKVTLKICYNSRHFSVSGLFKEFS